MTAQTETLAPVAVAPEARMPLSTDVVVLTVTGKMTDCYVITDPMGDSKKGPLERWFEIARCKSVRRTADRQFELTLTRDYVAKRGISHRDLPLAVEPAAPVEAAQEKSFLEQLKSAMDAEWDKYHWVRETHEDAELQELIGKTTSLPAALKKCRAYCKLMDEQQKNAQG